MQNPHPVDLKGVRVAVLISHGFELSEFDVPLWELRRAGARVDVLAVDPQQLEEGIQGMNGLDRARLVQADRLIQDASPSDYDALLIPGGAVSVEAMRESYFHQGFVRNFELDEKPIGVIGHAAWLLADTGVATNRTLTSQPAIKKDLERAGAVWKDQPVIQDGFIVSGRTTGDVEAFVHAWMEKLAGINLERVKAA